MHHVDRAGPALKIPRALKRSIPFALLIALIGMAALAPRAAVAQQSQYKIVVNGVELPTEEDMQVQNLTLFVPLDRNVVSALGGVLGIMPCAAGKECFTLSALGKVVSFTLGETQLSVDGRTFSAAAAPFRDQGVLFLPALNLFQSLDSKASWDETKGTLTVSTNISGATDYQRLSSILKLTEKQAPAAQPAAAQAQAQTGAPHIGYTFENQTRSLTIGVTGDQTLANVEEKGDIYNNFNLRAMGTLSNGYEFQGSLRTTETTDTAKKRGEINKLELGWTKNKIALNLYDVSPQFSKYVFRSYPFQGVDYKRKGKVYTVNTVFGKAMKMMRSSDYARYLGGVRVERSFKSPRPHVLGASIAKVHDTGTIIDLKKMANTTYEIDYSAELEKPWTVKAELAGGHNQIIGNSSSGGTARTVEFNYINRRVNWRNFYERTSNDFYSETSYFSRGKTEFSSLYNKKMNKKLMAGAGYKLKQIGYAKTYYYPANIQFIPFKKRPTSVAVTRNFEKTVSANGRIRDSKVYRWTDMFGKNRTDFTYERRKQKDFYGLSFMNKYNSMLQRPLTKKLDLELKVDQERWYHDRLSITRQQNLRLNYEIAPWTEMNINTGRYYNEPSNAFTSFRVGFQKLDIVNDWELRISLDRQNYRDYNINSMEVSYSFYR
jgi:hypothetical protein